MSLLDEIAQFLEDQGVGEVNDPLTRTIFESAMHDTATPDRCIGLFEYPGQPPMYTHDSPSPLFETAYFQVRCRAPDYPDAREDAKAAWDALAMIVNQSLSGVYYTGCTPLQSPFALPNDDHGRRIVCFNCRAVKVPS